MPDVLSIEALLHNNRFRKQYTTYETGTIAIMKTGSMFAALTNARNATIHYQATFSSADNAISKLAIVAEGTDFENFGCYSRHRFLVILLAL